MTNNKLKNSFIFLVVIAAVISAAIIFLPADAFAEGEGTVDGASTASEGFDAGDGSDSGGNIIESDGFAESGLPSGESGSCFPDDINEIPSPDSSAGTDTFPESPSPDINPDSTPPLDSNVEETSDSANQSSGSENPEAPETVSPVDSEAVSTDCGNSYVPTITPDAVAVSGTDPNFQIPGGYSGLVGGAEGTFTITFTEVGDKTIGSAQVEIPSGFSGVGFNNDWSTTNINTSDGQVWEGKLDGALIYLRAVNEAVDFLAKGESVSATFTATTPTTTGRYEFETKAWTDKTLADGVDNINNRAKGYGDPLVIVGFSVSSPGELSNVTNQDLHFVQTANIDLNVAPHNENAGWAPLGLGSGIGGPFFGSFNGNGFTISNLYISRPADIYDGLGDGTLGHYMGLFGKTANSVLLNITINNAAVTGSERVGALVGDSVNTTIHNCQITGNVSVNGKRYVGGLVGYSYLTRISGSHTTGVVSGTGVPENNSNVGGLVGQTYGLVGETYLGTIAGSYTSATVTGAGSNSGGLVGYNRHCPIYNSHATGAVTGTSYVGGLVGNNNDSISNSYAIGWVTGTGNVVGGLVGLNYGTITKSYATGAVTGTSSVGGLVGHNEDSTVTNSHATGSVDGDYNVGGLVGSIHDSTVTNSFATGNVTGSESKAGGLVGSSEVSTVTNSHATGDVIGNVHVGGLFGYNEDSTITNSYATGNVVGEWYVGGLVGGEWADRDATIYRSYSTGIVKGSREVGGLVGRLNGSGIYDSFSTSDVEATDSSGGGLVGSATDGALIKNSYAIGDVQGGNAIGGLIGSTASQIGIATVENCYAIGNVQGSDYVGRLIGHNAVSTITNCYAVDQGIYPLVGFGIAVDADNTTITAMKNIQTYLDAGWSITTTNVVINKAGDPPYPFPVLFWELDQDNEPVWYIYPASEDGNGNGNGGEDDNGNGNGDDNDNGNGNDSNQGPGSDSGFDFTGFPAPALPAAPLQTLLTVAPAAPLVSPGQFLVLAPEDAQTEAAPLVTPEFVRNGNREELTTVLAVYEELLQYFDENWETMSESEYALALLDLAAAWAAIQAVEASLNGEAADLDLALEAYLEARELLAEYGALLDETQLAVVEAILETVADLLTALGVDFSQPGL